MQLFLSMLPFYLLGNLHCLGMCGPLVMMIGQNPYRHWYFWGRAISYTIAGGIAGSLGALINIFLNEYKLAAFTSILFGGIILFLGFSSFFHWNYFSLSKIPFLNAFQKKMSSVLFKQSPESSFLLGFFTVTLPCGQTLVVFSACALSGSGWIGLFNGLAFALITSPSLFFSMRAYQVIGRIKNQANVLLNLLTILIGVMALCRGLAELDVIPHLVLHEKYHIVIY